MRFPLRVAVLAAFLAAPLFAQETGPAPVAVSPKDPQTEKILAEISATRIEATIRKLVSFKTRHTLSDTTSPDTGIGAARNWIKSEFEAISRDNGGRLQVAFDSFHAPPTPPRLPQGADIVNVVATLPGSKPWARDRMYVISGHYDSRELAIMNLDTPAPGANDDGSGTAAVLELARVMSKYEFDATLVFMTVAGEEQHSEGASHWAKEAKAKGLTIAGMFTDDIIGNTLHEDGTRDRSYVRVFAEGVPPLKELPPDLVRTLVTGGENDLPTRQLARFIQTVGARYVPQLPVRIVYRRDRYLRSGDHGPFLEAGYPAVRFTEPHESFPHQHQNLRVENGVQYGDLPEFVDFPYIAEVARVDAAALAELANAPAVPKGFQLETAKLDNDTTMRWEPNPEPDLAGYRIVWRDSTAPQWQHSVDVPKTETRHTVKDQSKDDYIFGLESVDTAGHASPAVYPTPRSGQ